MKSITAINWLRGFKDYWNALLDPLPLPITMPVLEYGDIEQPKTVKELIAERRTVLPVEPTPYVIEPVKLERLYRDERFDFGKISSHFIILDTDGDIYGPFLTYVRTKTMYDELKVKNGKDGPLRYVICGLMPMTHPLPKWKED